MGPASRSSCRRPDPRRRRDVAWKGVQEQEPEFVELRRKVRQRMDAIVATATLGLTNAPVQAMNNRIKLIVKMVYGFKNLDNLFSMVMLKYSDCR